MADANNNYSEAILEEVRGQYRTLQEGLDHLKGIPGKLEQIDDRLARVEGDVHVIKNCFKGA